MFNPTPPLYSRVLLTADSLGLVPGCDLLRKATAVKTAMAAGDPLAVAAANRELEAAYIGHINRGAN